MAKVKQEIIFKPMNIYKAEDFNQDIWSDEVKKYRDELYDIYFTPYKLTVPGYIIKKLNDLNLVVKPEEVSKVKENVRQSAEVCYLAAIAKGTIKDPNAEPMPEKIKQTLKQLSADKKKDVSSKYPWMIAGSTRYDKERGESLSDIKCTKCGELRTVISRQVYQIKLCKACKLKK